MAAGMDMLPMITKEIKLDEVPENVAALRTDKQECKISCVNPGA
jgi:threonine dehydrogenase-like Zn-dependent dehydrogenase